jgi:hypothetical protein
MKTADGTTRKNPKHAELRTVQREKVRKRRQSVPYNEKEFQKHETVGGTTRKNPKDMN